MIKLALLAAAAATLMTGCSTLSASEPTGGCPLTSYSGCSSMQDVYSAARTADPKLLTKNGVQNVFDIRAYSKDALRAMAEEGSARNDAPVVGGGKATLGNYPEKGGVDGGAPIYKSPRPMRVFTAPSVDGNGNLRSGEQVYFATPGEWNYGTLKKPGAAAGATGVSSGTFGPADDRNIGFIPVETKKKSNASASTGNNVTGPVLESTGNAAPAPVAAPAATPAADASKQAQPVIPATVNSQTGITQPYQRLTGN